MVIMIVVVMTIMVMMITMMGVMVVMVNLPLMWIISLDMSDVVSRQLVNCSLNILNVMFNHIFLQESIVRRSVRVQSGYPI